VRFYDIEWQIVANVAGSPRLLEKEQQIDAPGPGKSNLASGRGGMVLLA